MPGGAVARDGRLRVGQRILEVNGTSLLGASHDDAVQALKTVTDKLQVRAIQADKDFSSFDLNILFERRELRKLKCYRIPFDVLSRS